MRKLLFLIFVLNISLFSKGNKQYAKLISLSESLLYNFEFNSARAVIGSAIELKPERPEAYLNLSKIHLWFYLGSKEEEDYKSFISYTDSCLIRTERLIDKVENNPDLLYIIGNVYKYRAIIYGTKGNTLDAFWATKKSVSYFEEVIELDPNYYSAYGGIGMFEYALSYVPAFFDWALTISGLSADQESGFSFIELAVSKGKIDNIEYKFHLAKLLDEHLAEYKKSLSLLNALTKQFPKNSLFHYQKAIEYIKSHQLENAIKEIEIVQEINHPKFVQTNSFSNFLLGDIYFRISQYEKALEYYKKFLTSTKTVDYTGIASLRTAFCYNFLDNQNEFRRYLLLSSNGNLDLEDDKYAKDESLKILESKHIDEYETFLEIENKYLSGKYNECLAQADSTIDSLELDEIKSQILVYKRLILDRKGDKEEFLNLPTKLDSLGLNSENWVKPMTYYLNAKKSFLKKDWEMVEEYLDEAESANEYQKKNMIFSYINKLKRDLTKLIK